MEPTIAEIIILGILAIPCFIIILTGIFIGIRAFQDGKRRVRPNIYGYQLEKPLIDINNWGKR